MNELIITRHETTFIVQINRTHRLSLTRTLHKFTGLSNLNMQSPAQMLRDNPTIEISTLTNGQLFCLTRLSPP